MFNEFCSRCEMWRTGGGGDLLVMKQNDESPLFKKRKKKRRKRKCSQRTGSPHPSPSSPTSPFPGFFGGMCFWFPHPLPPPVPLSPGIISIQAHTEHCKLISLGYSRRKSGCQTFFPSPCLCAQPASGLGLAPGLSEPVACSNFAVSLHLIKCARSLPTCGAGSFGWASGLFPSGPFSAFSHC